MIELTKEECLNALEILDNPSRAIDRVIVSMVFSRLIKEHFELKEKYGKILDDVHDYRYSSHVDKMIVRNLIEHFKVNTIEELQNIYLNKPMAKKPILIADEGFDAEVSSHLCCPKCNKPVINVWSLREYKPRYCHYCGEALDWS